MFEVIEEMQIKSWQQKCGIFFKNANRKILFNQNIMNANYRASLNKLIQCKVRIKIKPLSSGDILW